MHAEPQPDLSDLPSIDDTIAAMSVLGRILDELRSKIAVTEQTVARLAKEKSSLQKELCIIVEHASFQKAPLTRASASRSTASSTTLDELSMLMKRMNSSSARRSQTC